ncbi:unnamed protein product [Orchesella dallaii]|uniref:G-protein coupled receptors family 2 profile 2 domain-containing protein n=1 Tax=Orchesella dallaii TaxID=48710 RepID=A0ABP1R8Y1_9HEXA
MTLQHRKKPSFLIIILFLIQHDVFEHTTAETAEVNSFSNQDQFYLNFLSSSEVQETIIQKCCAPSQKLNENGECVELDFEPQTVSLEKRIRRAIFNATSKNDSITTGEAEDSIVIGFLQRRPTCEDGVRKQRIYSILSEEPQLTSSLQFVTEEFDESTGNYTLIVDSRDYCLDWKHEEIITVEFCFKQSCLPLLNSKITSKSSPELSSKSLCLRKCCPPQHMIDRDACNCVKHDIPWQLSSLAQEDIGESSLMKGSTPSFGVDDANRAANGHAISLPVSWLTGPPNCDYYEVFIDNYERYYINSGGLLITEQLGTFAKTVPKDYCFDAVLQKRATGLQLDMNDGESENSSVTDGRNEILIYSRQVALVCFEKTVEKEKENNWKRVLYTILTAISCIFLLITCIIYTILRKELNLPGWLQFAYAFCLLLTFSLLTVAQLWTQQIHEISKGLCRALGYALHFFFLSCFFWLMSMNLDMFLSFRSSAIARGFEQSRGKRRFLEFTAFSIGFPTAITLLVLAVDSSYSDEPNIEGGSFWTLSKTGIGESSCVIELGNKMAQLHYFYGFVGTLLLVNLVIFICTLISLRNRERETRLAKRQSTSNYDYDRLQLFTRLFLIMGILWIFEVISWLFEVSNVMSDNMKLIFVFTDSLNALQGIAVFIMFIWKRQTWKQLKKKFKATFGKRGKRPLSRPSYNCTVSSNSHGATKSTSSVKSSHLSSTKSIDSSLMSSAPTVVTTVENNYSCIPK